MKGTHRVSPSSTWNYRRFSGLLAIVVAVVLTTGTTDLQAYTFTGRTGTKVEAEIVSVSVPKSTVRLRLPTGKEADVPFSSVSEADQAYIREWAATAAAQTPVPPAPVAPAPAPTPSAPAVASLTPIKPGGLPSTKATTPAGSPGETIVFEFPDLPKDKKDAVAACKVRLPSQYDPAKPMPLLLWFAGGDGGNDPKSGLPLVDEATWAVVAMPYPVTATNPRYAMNDGSMHIIRDYHMTMLKKVIAALPNIDPKLRFAAGFSNGAHTVGTYMADGERDFIDFFRGYIIIEGGGVRNEAKKTLRNSFAYLAWGDAAGNTASYMAYVQAATKDAKMKVTTRTMKGIGHGFPADEQSAVKTWIEKVAVPGILAVKP